MKKSTRYSPEVRERAVRMVLEHQAGHESQWAAMASVASKLGCSAETLRKWVRRAERDTGLRPGVKSEEGERLKALERENPELRRANEILRKAAAFFAQAELDRRGTQWCLSSTRTGRRTGSSLSAQSCRWPPRPTTRARRERPVVLLCRSERDVTRSCGRRSSGCGRRTSGSTESARCGVSSTGRALRRPDARWRG